MKHIYSLLIAFLVTLHLSAQKNLVPGYIITNTGDTVRGLVDFRDWENNPAKVEFESSTGEKYFLTPEGIRSFSTGPGAIYVSKRLAMDISPVKLDDLINHPGLKVVPDTAIFVTLLVRGKISLYYFHDKNGKDHFWMEKVNDSIYEMTVDRRIVVSQTNRGRSVATLKKYLILLPGLMNDCPAIDNMISSTTFTANSFKKLVTAYNACGSPAIASEVVPRKKTQFRFGLVAGATWLKLTFGSSLVSPLTEAELGSTWTWDAGVSLKIILPYLHGSWIIYNDLTYQPYSVSGTSQSSLPQTPWITNVYHYSFDMGYLKLNTMLRYQLPSWKVRPFANIGISNNYAVKMEANCTVDEINHITNVTTSSTKPALKETRSYEIGVLAGLGACYEGFGLELRYEWANGMSNELDVGSNQNSLTVLVSYTFGERRESK